MQYLLRTHEEIRTRFKNEGWHVTPHAVKNNPDIIRFVLVNTVTAEQYTVTHTVARYDASAPSAYAIQHVSYITVVDASASEASRLRIDNPPTVGIRKCRRCPRCRRDLQADECDSEHSQERQRAHRQFLLHTALVRLFAGIELPLARAFHRDSDERLTFNTIERALCVAMCLRRLYPFACNRDVRRTLVRMMITNGI